MTTQKRLLPALLFSLFAATSAPDAGAAQFSGVYVFGDSLSDAGYYRPVLAALGLPAPVVAQLGRFTTSPGPVWSELVSQFYGVAAAPSNVAGGNIFAQGGARVASPSASTPTGHPQRPVSTQIDEFLAAHGGAADPGALYAIWAGANDVFQNLGAFQAGAITQPQLQANVLGAATSEIQQVARLRAAGAQYILAFGLPDIGNTPAFIAGGPAAAAGATALSAGYNTTLFTGLAGAGIRAIPVDTFALMTEVRANPSAFGFTNATGIACGPFPPITTSGSAQFCLPSNLVASNAADTFVFADGVHPTSATHRLIADFVESLIEGPTQYSLLAEAPLRTRASHVRTISDGLTTGKQSEVGKFSVFAAADGSNFDIESGPGNTGLDSRTRSATIGVTMRASEAVMVGLAYGHGRNEGSFGGDAGGYRTREHTWSVFGSVKWRGFYGTGVLSQADIEFNDIQRNIRLGQNRRTATANTDGSNYSAHLNAGYDFPIGRFRVGPTVAVTTQNVEVNGFDEAGGGSAGLRIHAQKRRSEVWSAGARASMDLGGWTPWIRITADKERRDDVRHVSATPLTLAAIGNVYDIPAYRSDTSFMTGAIGVNGVITPHVAVGLAYYKVDSRSGIDEDGLQGMVSIRF